VSGVTIARWSKFRNVSLRAAGDLATKSQQIGWVTTHHAPFGKVLAPPKGPRARADKVEAVSFGVLTVWGLVPSL
jgi:hypothetical protein